VGVAVRGFIDEGLPESRDNWPDGVLEALGSFAQGDVVPCPPLVYQGDPARPVFRMTSVYAQEYSDPMPMTITGESAPRWAIVTSGTCDVAEEDMVWPRCPTVQISPVVDMSGIDPGDQKLIRDGRFNYLIHLPALSEQEDGFWVADLRLEYPVEKGWLAGQPRVPAFHSELEQEKVGRAIAHLRGRPAMARSFLEHVVAPLREHLTTLRKSDRSLANRIDDEVREWGVLVDSRLYPRRIEIVLLTEGQEASADVREWWRLAVDAIRSRPEALAAGMTILGPRFERLDVLPVTEYRRLAIQPRPHKRFSE
jgi:hypothetical protein